MRELISASLSDSRATNRFLPYVQMHEFEALLFSNPEILAECSGSRPSAPSGCDGT